MGTFLGVLGVFLVIAAGFLLLGLIAGELGIAAGAVLLAAVLVRAGLDACGKLSGRLDQIEKKRTPCWNSKRGVKLNE